MLDILGLLFFLINEDFYTIFIYQQFKSFIDIILNFSLEDAIDNIEKRKKFYKPMTLSWCFTLQL